MCAIIVISIIVILVALYIMGNRFDKVRSKELQDYVNQSRRYNPPKTRGSTGTILSRCTKCGMSISPESNRCSGCGHTK